MHVDDDAKPMAAKYLTKWRPGFDERFALKENKQEDEEKNTDTLLPAITA